MSEAKTKPVPIAKTWSPGALAAAKAFKDLKVAKPLPYQKTAKSAAIRRAVRAYYFG